MKKKFLSFLVSILVIVDSARTCKIRDTYNFKDIYIKPNSSLGTKLYHLKEGSTQIYISLCNPIPKEIFEAVNCTKQGYSPNTDYYYARFEMSYHDQNLKNSKNPLKFENQEMIQGDLKLVCTTFLNFESFNRFSYNRKLKFYEIEFNDKGEDDPTRIIFPKEKLEDDIIYKFSKDGYNEFLLKGKTENFTVQKGYLVGQSSTFLGFLVNLIIVFYMVRFAILSKEGVCYTSVFICGGRMRFFDHFVNFAVFWELINGIFQLVENPNAFVASVSSIVIPIQISLMTPQYLTHHFLTCKFPL